VMLGRLGCRSLRHRHGRRRLGLSGRSSRRHGHSRRRLGWGRGGRWRWLHGGRGCGARSAGLGQRPNEVAVARSATAIAVIVRFTTWVSCLAVEWPDHSAAYDTEAIFFLLWSVLITLWCEILTKLVRDIARKKAVPHRLFNRCGCRPLGPTQVRAGPPQRIRRGAAHGSSISDAIVLAVQGRPK
jgi:hypothetical protein